MQCSYSHTLEREVARTLHAGKLELLPFGLCEVLWLGAEACSKCLLPK